MRIYDAPARLPDNYLKRVETPAEFKNTSYRITFDPQTEEEARDIEAGRPTKFKPSWPPQGKGDKAAPKPKPSQDFKKAAWPPVKDDDEQPSQPNASGDNPNGDNEGNNNNSNIGPGNRDVQSPSGSGLPKPKKVVDDFRSHFERHRGKDGTKAYAVPPGIQYEVVDRGITTFENAIEIGEQSVGSSAEQWHLQQRAHSDPTQRHHQQQNQQGQVQQMVPQSMVLPLQQIPEAEDTEEEEDEEEEEEEEDEEEVESDASGQSL